MAGDFTTIARPYAEAAFAIAQAEGALDTWSEALHRLGAIVSDPQARDLLGNPNVSRERRCELLLAVAAELQGAALSSGPSNLVRILAANGRLPLLPEIARLFEQRKTAAQGVRHVVVRSAFALEDADHLALIGSLKTYLGAEVELRVEHDEGLIGGVEIRADDLVIDGSIRGKLTQLANELQF